MIRKRLMFDMNEFSAIQIHRYLSSKFEGTHESLYSTLNEKYDVIECDFLPELGFLLASKSQAIVFVYSLDTFKEEYKVESEVFNLLKIDVNVFTYGTPLRTILDEFNNLSSIEDDLFAYELGVLEDSYFPYDEQTYDDLENENLDIYEPRECYDEYEKMFTEVVILIDNRLVKLIDITLKQWLDLKYGDHKKVDKETVEAVVATWLIRSYRKQFKEYIKIKRRLEKRGDDEEVLTNDEFFDLEEENLHEGSLPINFLNFKAEPLVFRGLVAKDINKEHSILREFIRSFTLLFFFLGMIFLSSSHSVTPKSPKLKGLWTSKFLLSMLLNTVIAIVATSVDESLKGFGDWVSSSSVFWMSSSISSPASRISLSLSSPRFIIIKDRYLKSSGIGLVHQGITIKEYLAIEDKKVAKQRMNSSLEKLCVEDDLFAYELRVLEDSFFPYDEQTYDDLKNGNIDICEPQQCYDEYKKIFAEVVILIENRLVKLIDITLKQWLDLKYRDYRKVDKEIMEAIVATWLIQSYRKQFEEYIKIKRQFEVNGLNIDVECDPTNFKYKECTMTLLEKRIGTDIFDFETHLCKEFKEFNHLLQIDIDVRTRDLSGLRHMKIIKMHGSTNGIMNCHGLMKNHG
nr:ATP-dependent DNA helicase PIF1 [Tanacetum cinerariifolium]